VVYPSAKFSNSRDSTGSNFLTLHRKNGPLNSHLYLLAALAQLNDLRLEIRSK
jgi:hypothetical protein